MKNALSLTKSLLLAATLLVLSLGFMPKTAEADITIYCDGTNNHCAYVIGPGVIIDIDLGRYLGHTIEQ